MKPVVHAATKIRQLRMPGAKHKGVPSGHEGIGLNVLAVHEMIVTIRREHAHGRLAEILANSDDAEFGPNTNSFHDHVLAPDSELQSHGVVMAARKTSRCEKDVTMGWLCGQRTPIELKWRQAQRYEPSF